MCILTRKYLSNDSFVFLLDQSFRISSVSTKMTMSLKTDISDDSTVQNLIKRRVFW